MYVPSARVLTHWLEFDVPVILVVFFAPQPVQFPYRVMFAKFELSIAEQLKVVVVFWVAWLSVGEFRVVTVYWVNGLNSYAPMSHSAVPLLSPSIGRVVPSRSVVKYAERSVPESIAGELILRWKS